MKHEADVCIRVRVPFDFDVPERREEPVEAAPGAEGVEPSYEIVNDHEIQVARRNAARHVERELRDLLEGAVGTHGEVVDYVVEEVREA